MSKGLLKQAAILVAARSCRTLPGPQLPCRGLGHLTLREIFPKRFWPWVYQARPHVRPVEPPIATSRGLQAFAALASISSAIHFLAEEAREEVRRVSESRAGVG